jgi:hypothetical protein
MIASDAVQVAIFNALNGNITGTVHDAVPAGTAAPYTTIGETTGRPWDTMTEEGAEETVTLHVWSRQFGSRQAKQIMEQIDEILHNARLTLAGATMVIMVRDADGLFTDDESEPGQVWRHGWLRYRVNITQ